MQATHGSTSSAPSQIDHDQQLNDAMVRNYFPGALRNDDTIKAVVSIAEGLGISKANSLFAYSVCQEEINQGVGSLANVLQTNFCYSVSLAGLAGIPFSGKSGFSTFASQVPEDGVIFILFAPHCAVSTKTVGSSHQDQDDYICGYYHHCNEKKLSPACGAALEAYKAAKEMKEQPLFDLFSRDVEMDYIKRLCYDNKERIAAADNQPAEITNLMYEHIHDYIMRIVDNQNLVQHRKIVIMGGIQINV